MRQTETRERVSADMLCRKCGFARRVEFGFDPVYRSWFTVIDDADLCPICETILDVIESRPRLVIVTAATETEAA